MHVLVEGTPPLCRFTPMNHSLPQQPPSNYAAADRALMPMHKDLRLAGQLPPLDAPHHMRASEWAPFREGVVTRSAHGAGSILSIGLDKARALPCCSAHVLQQGLTCTNSCGPGLACMDDFE